MNLLSKLDKRQKKIFAILCVVVVILIWQVFSLFSTNNSTPPVKVAAPKGTAPTPRLAHSVAPKPAAGAAVDVSGNTQEEYLRLVREYQMAQIQRMIAEDNQAIALAKQRAAEAMVQTSKLLGNGNVTVNNNNNNVRGYQLVYTGEQEQGGWTATLKKDNQTFDVMEGKQLPDGFRVESIDENGVVLMQGSVKKLITFSGEVQTAQQTAPTTNQAEPLKVNQIKPAPAPVQTTAIVKPGATQVVANTNTNAAPKSVPTEVAIAPAVKPVIAQTAPAKPVTIPAPIAATNKPTTPAPVAKNNIENPAEALAARIKLTDNTITQVQLPKIAIAAPHNVFAQSSNPSAKPTSTAEVAHKSQPSTIASPAVNVAKNDVSHPAPAIAQKTNVAQANVQQPVATATKQSEVVASNVQVPFPRITESRESQVTKSSSVAPVSAEPIAEKVVAQENTQSKLTQQQLSTINPRYYTIQLVADNRLSTIVGFIKTNNLGEQATHFRGYNKNGDQQYFVIYGQYKSVAEANAALRKLPTTVKQHGAFVEPFSVVQNKINDRNNTEIVSIPAVPDNDG